MKTPFGNSPKMLIYIFVFVTLFLAAALTKCHGAELGFEGGRAVIRGETPAAALTLTFPHPWYHPETQHFPDYPTDWRTNPGPGDADLELGMLLVGAYDINGVTQHNQLIAEAMVVDGFGHFDIGIGPAYLQNEDAINGSHLNFSLKLGYRWHRVGVVWRHISNAGTKTPNQGRDMVLLTYRF